VEAAGAIEDVADVNAPFIAHCVVVWLGDFEVVDLVVVVDLVEHLDERCILLVEGV